MRGLVVGRALNEPLLLLAAISSILLATVTLVALTTHASSTVEAGVRRAVAAVPLATKAGVVTASATPDTFGAVDTLVREQIGAAHSAVPVDVTLSALSGSYVAPGQERAKTPELITFGLYDTLQQHAKLVSGSWPKDGDPVEAAVSQQVADALDLAPGRLITTQSRVDHRQVKVRISGVFQLDDPFGPRWATEPLLARGIQIGNYTTYGPLMVTRATFVARFAAQVTPTWLAVPDLRPLSLERLRPFAADVDAMRKRLERAGCQGCAADSGLPDALAQLTVAALVARSTMLIPVLMLLLLAAYALVLTARLLAGHRRMEIALLRARGAGTVRLSLLAGAEALLIALPCAIVAPFLAPPLLGLTTSTSTPVRLTPQAFAVSLAVALASAILLALPAIAGARRTYVEEQTARAGRGLLQRAGGDVALLGVAALAVWQLRHYGAAVTATSAGELGIDPLIVSGPALALLAGGLLGMRLIPRVSGLAVRLAVRQRGLTATMGAWQVSRRPARYAGPALLLTMAIAIGGVSLAMSATWRHSQADQAAHTSGADLRVSDVSEGRELGVLGRGATFAALPGVTSISPGYRGLADVGGKDATMLALDATKLGGLMRLRQDLSPDSVASLASRLRTARPALIPFKGRRAVFDLELNAAAQPMEARATLVDGLGVWREVPIGRLREGANQVELDLAALAGHAGRLSEPISLHGFTFEVPAEADAFTITARGLPGARWAAMRRGPGQPSLTQTATGFAVGLPPGQESGALLVSLAAQGPAAPLPVVLTRDLATALKVSPGKVTALRLEGRTVQALIAGVVDELPSTAPGRPAVLVDLAGVQAGERAAALAPKPVTEWWLATRSGETAAAVEVLRRHPEWSATVVDLHGTTAKLRDDPLSSGLQGALVLGFCAALAFAALGFLVNAAVTARERTDEFAVLRALGAGVRQLFWLMAVEQSFVVFLSVTAGTALAFGVGALVVPHIVLTGQATAVTPGVLYDVPWVPTAALLAVVTVLLFAIVAALSRALRLRPPGGEGR